MTINANTKIASLIKQHPGALEAIVSLSPKFEKLRNPILRKVIAGRTSISMASKLGGCRVDDFFHKLAPLGFIIDKTTEATEDAAESLPLPAFLKNAAPDSITGLDVRPVIEAGKDPLQLILQKVKALEQGHVLKIINSFEPTPLLHLLGKQGFESFVEKRADDLVHTYFYKRTNGPLTIPAANADSEGWEEILEKFKDKLVPIDVRQLEMPLPMHTILESLSVLPAGRALFVYHKRIPVFLLPELEERGFSYRIREISETEVHLLIYKV